MASSPWPQLHVTCIFAQLSAVLRNLRFLAVRLVANPASPPSGLCMSKPKVFLVLCNRLAAVVFAVCMAHFDALVQGESARLVACRSSPNSGIHEG